MTKSKPDSDRASRLEEAAEVYYQKHDSRWIDIKEAFEAGAKWLLEQLELEFNSSWTNDLDYELYLKMQVQMKQLAGEE